MTLLVWVTGGVRVKIKAPMVIFTKSNRNYPICGVADNIPWVTYRSESKGWMDTTLFVEYFVEAQCYQRNLYQHIKHIWCDNSSNHNATPTLQNILAQKILFMLSSSLLNKLCSTNRPICDLKD